MFYFVSIGTVFVRYPTSLVAHGMQSHSVGHANPLSLPKFLCIVHSNSKEDELWFCIQQIKSHILVWLPEILLMFSGGAILGRVVLQQIKRGLCQRRVPQDMSMYFLSNELVLNATLLDILVTQVYISGWHRAAGSSKRLARCSFSIRILDELHYLQTYDKSFICGIVIFVIQAVRLRPDPRNTVHIFCACNGWWSYC